MSDALVTQLARSLNLPPDAARHTLNHLVAALRDQLDATGQARVPGLGTFRRDEGGLRFLPDDTLARAVNHRYAGLRPIEAGPGAVGAKPEAKPTEAADPFAEVSPSEEPAETADAGLPEAAVFQPLESFIEPDEIEQDEPDDEFAPKPADAFEQARPEDEPPLEAPPAEEPAADERAAEEPSAEEEPVVEAETETDAERGLDELLAGTWTEHPDTPDAEHVLGPLPPDDVEDADYTLVEPDEAVESAEADAPDGEIIEATAPDVDTETESAGSVEGEQDEEALLAAANAGWEEGNWDEAIEEDEPASYEDEPASYEDEIPYEDEAIYEDEVEPDVYAEPSVPPDPTEPPPIAAEPPPEPKPEPAPETQPVAPAVAATSRPRADRAPAEPSRSRTTPIALTVLGVVLGIIALLWFLNREPEGPAVAEQPAPADTAVVAGTPPPATDTLAAFTPADTAATVAEAPPEPDEPAAPADPLRGSAGIDPDAGGYTWVVASEIDQAVAERRAERYREQGLRAGVVAEAAAGRTRYRVSLGQFSSIAEAEAHRNDLPAGVPSDSWILQL